MLEDVQEVLITSEAIQARIVELGRQISADYAGKRPVLIGVLKGAAMFMMDLIRAMDIPVEVDFMAVSSYGASTHTSGVVRILKDLDASIEGRHALIVEDIVDTGLTLKYITENLIVRHPASLRICALLDKAENRRVNIPVDYVGFVIPNKFVIGYGLDYGEIYRNLGFIGVLKPEKYEE
ncbi:MAG: hypoxanthine phosphoribosyltransferase [Chloroflexi bacterium]|nr:hypoxanthine phosphoribosyltransferase [Chloroflexota bacterium]MBI5956771.1 hypoxanthine phosphoribosyltransferase [Chloroflexota bacterium]